MSIELKIELTGAVVYVRQPRAGGEKVAVLLLGQGEHAHHMPPHRPTFVFDPEDVDKVAGLPAQIIHTGEHKLGLQVDMTGFDLVLGEQRGGLAVGLGGGLPFNRVVDLKDLLPDKANAKIREGLTTRFEDPNAKFGYPLVAGRLFLDSGALDAVGPVASKLHYVRWQFAYVADKEHVQLETLATDRVAFRCALADGSLDFVSWSGPRKAGVTFRGNAESRRVTARLACAPGLPLADAEKGGSFDLANDDSHFEMAYDVLEVPPDFKPVPQLPSNLRGERSPGKNCFKAVQVTDTD